MTSLRDDIRAADALIETSSADTVIRCIDAGNLHGAAELLGQSAALQEACMNQGSADALYALCERLDEAAA